MKLNNRSIYGCTEAPAGFTAPNNSLLTYNPETNRLYIHLLDYPLQSLLLPGYEGKVKYVQFLHDASEIKFSAPPKRNRGGGIEGTGDLSLSLPVAKPDVEIPVIEIFLK